MRAILVVFMTQYLMDASGNFAPMTANEAKGYFHLFVSITYFTPFLGALLADSVLGKYRTIILLSLVYCLGHFCLALDDTRTGLLVGQALIALGAGGIKPCVSAHVGDQFGASNQHWLSKVFSWFYLTINLGLCRYVTGTLVAQKLWRIGRIFGAWCVDAAGDGIFWSGRYRFVHIPAAGMGFVREALSGVGLRCLVRLSGIYLFIAMFWALFDQMAHPGSYKLNKWIAVYSASKSCPRKFNQPIHC